MPQPDLDAVITNLSDIAAPMLESKAVPGCSIGLLHAGQERMACLGLTSVENPLPVTPDTLFQIGSITKTFTGMASMRLVERGMLDLDAPVRRYLPDLRLQDESVASSVTMRHLLTHTGGWVGDYFNDLGEGEDALERMVGGLHALPQITPLGEFWSYNNSGFYIAGRVIAVVTGQSFEAALRDLALQPLGMEHTLLSASAVITYRFVVGHKERDGKPEVARPWQIGRAANPAGGLISTVPELFKYAQFQMGDGAAATGERLLSPESMRALHAPLLPSSAGDQVALTWFVSRWDGLDILQHGGGTNGQITLFAVAPAVQTAVIVLTNGQKGGEICAELLRAAFKALCGVERQKAQPKELTQDELAAYAGVYLAPLSLLEISAEAPALVLQDVPQGGFPSPDSPPGPKPPPRKLAVCDGDRIIDLSESAPTPRGEFLRGASGRIEWLRIGGRMHRRQ